jgi:hypothetical protein
VDPEIACRLNIGLGTMRSPVHNLFGELNAERRGQVVAFSCDYEQHPG